MRVVFILFLAPENLLSDKKDSKAAARQHYLVIKMAETFLLKLDF